MSDALPILEGPGLAEHCECYVCPGLLGCLHPTATWYERGGAVIALCQACADDHGDRAVAMLAP